MFHCIELIQSFTAFIFDPFFLKFDLWKRHIIILKIRSHIRLPKYFAAVLARGKLFRPRQAQWARSF